jgi:hypothetical protein
VFTLTVFEQNNAIEKALPHRDMYAMYLRKSRADMELEAMGEGETLAKHKAMLYKLAAKHDIHPDQIVIYQEIVSGESLQDRPEALRLIDDVYARKYKGVLVVEVERLARGNTKDQGEVADAFQLTDTKIITPVKVYDPNDEFDQEYFEFGLFMSRREYKTIRRRLEAGKLQTVLDGNYVLPQRIFGYNIKKEGKNNRYLVINEKEEKYVHMMFDWYTEEGRSCGWIARQFTMMGIPTPYKRKEWEKATISDMLKNTHYIGMIPWGKYKTVKTKDPETGKVIKHRVKAKPEEIRQIKGKHKAIISEEQFYKAQNRFTQLPTNLDVQIMNPLAGIMHCADCGKSFFRLDVGHGKAVRFSHRSSTLCKKKSLPVVDVMDALVEGLQACIADYEIKMKNDSNETERIRHLDMIQAMEAELVKQERKRKKLFDDYEDEVYTRDEFVERKQVYAQLIDDLKAQIHQAKENLPEAVDYSEKIVTLHQMIEMIRNEEVDAQAKNDFLRKYIEDIKYDVIDYGRMKGGKPVLDVFLK